MLASMSVRFSSFGGGAGCGVFVFDPALAAELCGLPVAALPESGASAEAEGPDGCAASIAGVKSMKNATASSFMVEPFAFEFAFLIESRKAGLPAISSAIRAAAADNSARQRPGPQALVEEGCGPGLATHPPLYAVNPPRVPSWRARYSSPQDSCTARGRPDGPPLPGRAPASPTTPARGPTRPEHPESPERAGFLRAA